MKDLNKLSKEIYEANKAKGFHDEKHSEEHMMCLVISELMEAVEADRKGRRADLMALKACMCGVLDEDYEEQFSKSFTSLVKDTVEDELADAVIRLLDTAGALGVSINIEDVNEAIECFDKESFAKMKFTECIYRITFATVEHPCAIIDSLASILAYCDLLGIDLWKHVELKLKYNSLRPYKHGKIY